LRAPFMGLLVLSEEVYLLVTNDLKNSLLKLITPLMNQIEITTASICEGINTLAECCKVVKTTCSHVFR
ncbi:hypothetical protein ACFL4T_08985, partial [candidate division KSB1 bacterium]